MTSTPDAAPQKEGLFASAYRLMTALFTMRTPKNVTTRNRKGKSSQSKMLCINKIADSLATKTENQGSLDNSMKMSPPNEMFLLNAWCEKV